MKIELNAKLEELPVMMTVREVAQFWRCSPKTVYDLVKDRKSTRLNSSHTVISYAVFCLKKKK